MPGLWLALALKIVLNSCTDEIFQSCFVNLLAFVDIDGAPDIAVEAGVEQTGGVFQGSPFGKGHLDDALVRLAGADDAAVGPDRSTHPLPLFNDLRVGFVYDLTNFREHLPAPVPKFVDLRVDKGRGRFHRDSPFHVPLNSRIHFRCAQRNLQPRNKVLANIKVALEAAPPPKKACHFDRPRGVEKTRDAERDANVGGALCVKKPQHFTDVCITKEVKGARRTTHAQVTLSSFNHTPLKRGEKPWLDK